MANDPVALQTMLNRLHMYAQRKHLIINTAKSEVVHFNSYGSGLPVFRIRGDATGTQGVFQISWHDASQVHEHGQVL
eukprot:905049-Pelagomonas_calceolata.AAC.1